MIYKIDTCAGCGKQRPIVNRKHMMCNDCNYERIHGEKRKRTPIHSTSRIKPRSAKPKRVKTDNGIASERELFDYIWSTRPHTSEVSGKPLIAKPHSPEWFWYFSHLLSKGAYPSERLVVENILLKTKDEHWMWHNVARSELEKLPIWKPIFKRYDERKLNYYRRHNLRTEV